MRLFIFFDLPVGTAAQRRAHGKFRKFLVKEGYIMMQESVYTKLVLTSKHAPGLIERLKENRPSEGLIQALLVTEQQFAKMTYITGGSSDTDILDDTETLIIL